MANPLNYNTDNDCDQIYDFDVKNSNIAVIKDSAISVCSLNMRSLTVSSDCVNLKRIFQIGHDVMQCCQKNLLLKLSKCLLNAHHFFNQMRTFCLPIICEMRTF